MRELIIFGLSVLCLILGPVLMILSDGCSTYSLSAILLGLVGLLYLTLED